MPDVGGGNPGLTYIWTTAVRGVTSQNPNAADVHGVKHRIAAAIALGLPSVTRRESAAFWYAYEGRTLNDKQIGRLTNLYTRAGLPLPLTPVPGGPSIADQAGARPFADWGFLASATYRRGRKPKNKKKKKSRLRDAAAVLAGRVLQTGEEALGDLLSKARGAARYIEPEFERLLKKVPSEFERLIYRTPDFVPGAARTAASTAARTAATVAGSAAAVIAGVLYPSSIGQEPPWSPPPPRGPKSTARPGPSAPPSPPPRRVILPAPSPTGPGQTMPRPLPRTGSRPSPAPVSNPGTLPGPLPAPRVSTVPSPSRAPRTAPSAAPRPSPFAFPSWLLAPLALGISARGSVPRSKPRVVVWPQQSPLTRPQPSPAQSDCNCEKPTRTKRERKQRCSNPIISRTRKGDIITITRRIKCPESSRRKRA